MRFLDLTGQRFGRLVVNSLHPDRVYGNTQWNCTCDCGNNVVVRGGLMTDGRTQSCGCLKNECVQPPGILGLVNYYKKNIKKHGLTWDLSLDDARRLFLGNCTYCGAVPATKYKYEGTKVPVYLMRNGVDRVDNTLGYTSSNCVTACWRCNRAKCDKTSNEFKNMICEIYMHWACK